MAVPDARQFSLDSFLDCGVFATIAFVEKRKLLASELGTLNEIPDGLAQAHFPGLPRDEAHSIAHKLWRPVYWHLFLDEVKKCRDPKRSMLTRYTTERQVLMGERLLRGRNGTFYNVVRNDVLEEYLEKAFLSGETLAGVLRNEIRQKYGSLFRGIMQKHGLR